MSHAIRIHSPGGPEALIYEDVAVGAPGPGEARVRHTAIGVNFIDTYHRSGLYALPLPSGIGSEAAGVIESVGSSVDWVKPGDRVAYCGGAPGAYTTERVMPAERLVKLPDGIDDRTAATLMLKASPFNTCFGRHSDCKAAKRFSSTRRRAASDRSHANGRVR